MTQSKSRLVPCKPLSHYAILSATGVDFSWKKTNEAHLPPHSWKQEQTVARLLVVTMLLKLLLRTAAPTVTPQGNARREDSWNVRFIVPSCSFGEEVPTYNFNINNINEVKIQTQKNKVPRRLFLASNSVLGTLFLSGGRVRQM